MPNKLEKAFREGFKKEAQQSSSNQSSYLDDFIAGMEPTGVYTFEYGMDNEGESNSEYLGHQTAGTAGGFLGGAALSTALTGLGMLGLGKGLGAAGASKGLAKGMQTGGKDALKLFNPKAAYRSIKQAPEAARLFERRKGLVSDLSDAATNFNLSKLHGPSSIKSVMDDSADFYSRYGKTPENAFRESAGVMGGGVAGILGGGLSGLSSLTQYEAGRGTRDNQA